MRFISESDGGFHPNPTKGSPHHGLEFLDGIFARPTSQEGGGLSDNQGRTAREKLIQNWLPKYADAKAVALEFAEAVGNPGQACSIEDLFPEAFYLARAQSAYECQVPATVFSPAALPSGRPLCQRVDGAFHSVNAVFNRRLVGRRLAADIRQLRSMVDLPEMTRFLTEKLLASIKTAFTVGWFEAFRIAALQ